MLRGTIYLTFCLLIVIIGTANAQGDFFGIADNYLLGTQPFDICCADFDGINGDDFAVVSQNADFAYVYLNDGDGTFTYSNAYAAYDAPKSIVSADFDGINGPDLAYVTYNNNRLIVRLNDGDGTFDDVIRNMAVGSGDTRPQCVYAADFDGFNGPDIVTSNAGGSSVSVFFNVGDGTFTLPVNLTVGPNPSQLVAADFGGSSHPDIAVATVIYDSLEILINNGDSTFQPPITYPAPTTSIGMDFADFDGINGNDLILGSYNSVGLSLYLNNGDGTFADSVIVSSIVYPRSVACIDVDQDSNMDLVVPMEMRDSVAVFLGNGNGTFQAQDTYAAGDGPRGIEEGDFNGDAYPDIAIANLNGNDVSVFLNQEGPVDITDVSRNTLPDQFRLSQNYPNPFNPSTNIHFDLLKRSQVVISIYNMLGQQIKILADEELPAGTYSVEWDGTNEECQTVSTGVYLYNLEVDGFIETKKMMLLK